MGTRPALMELPPRTRRIHFQHNQPGTASGTTSAYAENTTRALASHTIKRNYLRVRGEYMAAGMNPFPRKELPPRTRRIRRGGNHRTIPGGTTSAYAENTNFIVPNNLIMRNYLRVRGEYASWGKKRRPRMELPPRTRRIPSRYVLIVANSGTTSAYAENTRRSRKILLSRWNYLRVRGEYSWIAETFSSSQELPPRTRRIPGCGYCPVPPQGTTSAYAENTTRWVWNE